MDFAEVVDALRIFPRWLVISYFVYTGWECATVTLWYCRLPPANRTIEVTAFFSMLMGGIWGLAAYVFKLYTDGGVDWNKYRAINDQTLPVRGPGGPAA
jgi:hypothetical protein